MSRPRAGGAGLWPARFGARRALRLADLADARWIAADDVAPVLAELRRHAGTGGFQAALRYTGQDVTALVALASEGHGLTPLPETVPLRQPGLTAVPTVPRLCHRLELVHAVLPADSPAAGLAALLAGR